MRDRRSDTRSRLLGAAAELFAERGFHGTKVRDIAERAGVNLASGHYHFGSKKELYLAVLRTHFAEVRSLLERRDARPAEKVLRGLSRDALERLLEARIRVMLEIVTGAQPDLHFALFQREMTDPSEALPVIVEEFIRPMKEEMEAIVAHLAPHLHGRERERCVYSIVAQVLFFRFAMPVLLEMQGRTRYARGFTDEIARHVSAFSLAAMGVGARNGGASGAG